MISVEMHDNVAVLTLDDPDKGVNVLSNHVLEDFDRQLTELEQKSGVAGLVIISGKEGNFIAGADLREFVASLDEPKEAVQQVAERGQQLFARLAKCPFVTVAAIGGLCVGGGSELAMWCDRRVMTDDSSTSFAFPEVKLGLFPGWGGTARMPRLVGLGNAVELVTGGEPIGAREAAVMGLAELAEPDQLLEAALAIVRGEHQSQAFQKDRDCWEAPLGLSETELGFIGATASAYIQGQTKGHYPAPMAALEVMLGAAGVDVWTACKMEAEGFTELWGTSENRALLNVFFLRDGNKKQEGPAGAQAAEITSASVIGAGIMGQGIAAANVKKQLPVALGDMSAEAVGRGVQGVLTEVSFNKKTRGPDVEKALKFTPLVNGTTNDKELATADIVIEAIYENADAKRELYARLEPQLGEQAILCSNTSTIPITELAKELKHPDRFCGLHFFNPVRRMPLVEVIRGEKTSDDTVATAVQYAKRLGKSPIVVGDGPGFLVNRVLLPYMNEALLLLEEGASIKAVDKAATSFGMPMGPISLYDTVGLDVALHAGKVMQEAFPDRVVPSKILPAMVEAKRLGQKNGKGFFDYKTDKRGRSKPQPSEEAQSIVDSIATAKEPETPKSDFADRLFLPMLLEATRLLEEGIVANVRDVDLGMIFGTGFPPFKGGLFFWADAVGAAQIVEKLSQFESLGERYKPTKLLLDAAKENRKFYDQGQHTI